MVRVGAGRMTWQAWSTTSTAVNAMPLDLKTRTLYLVRHHASTFGRHVGHKARLLPRAAAQRVAKRLRHAGLFITLDRIKVNVTPEQAAYLKRRYS